MERGTPLAPSSSSFARFGFGFGKWSIENIESLQNLQPFINGRVNSERVATFQNILFLPINTIQSSEYFPTNFMIFLLLKNTYFFAYFPAVDWFADSRVFGIYTLLIKIILPWEVIFQIKLRILEDNNFLKGTLWVQWTWSSSNSKEDISDSGTFLQI